LPETFMGILVSDGWAVYRLFLEAQRQSCLLHLMRRGHGLKEVAHGRGREIPGLVLGLLGDALLVRARRDAGELSEPGPQAEVASLRQRLDQLLSRPAVRHPGNRRLLKHLANERHALFTFLSQPGIEATNWRAEQGLRPVVVNRKVYGGNRDWSGAQALQRIARVLRTCHLHQVDPLAAPTTLPQRTHPAPAPSPADGPLGRRETPRSRRQPPTSSSSPDRLRFRLQLIEGEGDREVVTADFPCDGCLVIVGELPGPRPGRFHSHLATAGPAE